MAREPGRIRRRDKKNITSCVAHINASFNNTMITITDAQGNAISWSSAGMMGFKGSRKSTPYAAQVAAAERGELADPAVRDHGAAPRQCQKSLAILAAGAEPPRICGAASEEGVSSGLL